MSFQTAVAAAGEMADEDTARSVTIRTAIGSVHFLIETHSYMFQVVAASATIDMYH
jgi:hypothetical protein